MPRPTLAQSPLLHPISETCVWFDFVFVADFGGWGIVTGSDRGTVCSWSRVEEVLIAKDIMYVLGVGGNKSLLGGQMFIFYFEYV